MSDRLTEIEARARASHGFCCYSSAVTARDRGLSASDETLWLVAQVRERDAEIARLRADAAGHGSLLRTVLESRGRAEDDSDAAHRRAEKAEAEAARLREALATASDARATIRDCFRCLKCDACLRRLEAGSEAPDA